MNHNKLFALLILHVGTFACFAQQNPSPLPPSYHTVLTSDAFNVLSVHYGPHEKVPVHDHPATPTVYVYLNNSGPVNIIHEATPPETITRPPTHLGAFRFNRGMVERHSIENLSDLPSLFLRVELPNLTLPAGTPDFRGPAPADLTHNLNTVEFSSPHITVLRVLCVDPTPCNVPPTPFPSLLVALSPTLVIHHRQPAKIGLGTVLPIAPNQAFQISPAASEPAHILLISRH